MGGGRGIVFVLGFFEEDSPTSKKKLRLTA